MNTKNDFLKKLKNLKERYYKPILFKFLNPQEREWVRSIFKDFVVYESDDFSEYRRVFVSDTDTNPDFEICRLKTLCKDETITHRDVLGSIMALGVSREVIGDIHLVNDEIHIEVVKQMCLYIKELRQIKRNDVHFEQSQDKPVLPDLATETISISLDSLRIDAIIAKAFLINREDVKTLVNQDKVKNNFVLVQKHTTICKPCDIISVRGFGRVVILEILGTSKKQKTRVKCELLR